MSQRRKPAHDPVGARRAVGWRTLAVAAIGIGACGLAACGGGGSDNTATGDGGTTSTSSATTLSTDTSGGGGDGLQGDPHGKVRVVNLFLRDNAAYGPIDIYDTPNPAAGDEPLIAALGYGEISDYVEPRSVGSSSMLYQYPAGSVERQADGFGGSGLSNGGWEDGDQATIVISAAKGIEDGAPTNPQYTEISESDTAASWNAIPGKGAILANASGAGVESGAATVTLVVDAACPMRVDPENSPGGGQGIDSIANGNAVTYEVAPGTHEIGLLATDPSTGLSTCTGDTAMAQASIDTPAGGRVEVFVFGTSPTDLQLVTAPVDEP